MKNVTAILMLLCALFIFPQEVTAEVILDISNEQTLSDLLSDGTLLFVIDYAGDVFAVDRENMKTTEIGVRIDLDTEHPLIVDGELFVYNGSALECVTTEDQVGSFVLPDDLMTGSNTWLLTDMQQVNDHIFGYYYDTVNGISAICYYDCGDDDVSWCEVDMMTEYFCDEAGKSYAVTFDSELNITTVLRVDWEESCTEEILSLSGNYSHFQAVGERYCAINTAESCFVQIVDGREIVSIYSPYASVVIDSVVVDGEYWVCGSYGLYTPSWEDTQREERILKIQGSGPNAIDQEFLLKHPDVKIEYVPSTAYESMGVYNAIISGVIELDVCLIDTSVTAEAFLKKGYTLDLSVFPELRDKAQSMYDPIRKFIFEEEKLLFIPYSMDLGAILEYRADALKMAGLSETELPKTIEELLDLIIEWEDDVVVPILFDESPHKELLLRVLESYIANCRHTDNEIVFNTPTFRRLLTKTRAAASVSATQSYEYNPAKLFVQVGSEIPGICSVVFPLTENEFPRYTGRLFGWAIVADSKQIDLAVEYVIFRMEKVTKATEVLLYNDTYEAIEREYFSTLLAEWLTELDRLEIMLAAEDNPIVQRDIQEQIVKLNDQITHPLDSLRYAITSDEIAFYQKEVIPYIEFIFSDPITDPCITSLWVKQLIEQYTTGVISDDMFIRELDKRIWMMEMEVGEY